MELLLFDGMVRAAVAAPWGWRLYQDNTGEGARPRASVRRSCEPGPSLDPTRHLRTTESESPDASILVNQAVCQRGRHDSGAVRQASGGCPVPAPTLSAGQLPEGSIGVPRGASG